MGPEINCGTDCEESYAKGTKVPLTATADNGSTFVNWGGACSGKGACSVTMDSAKTVTATFNTTSTTPITYALTVTQPQNGKITSDTGGIDCGATCSASYASGAKVTLTAIANTGYELGSWGGACSGATNMTCQVTMDSTKTVTATFNETPVTTPTYVLTVNKVGTGKGSVTSAPEGISCDDDCSNDTGTYNASVVVTLTAEEAEGSTFAGWSGACTNSTGPCEVAMNEAKTVTATFGTASTQLEAPEIESFQAVRSTITAGETVDLVWNLSGGPSDFSLIINDVTEQSLTVTGRTSVPVSPDSTTTYRLSVTNDGGDDIKYTTVIVN